jgi:peroxiredoxin
VGYSGVARRTIFIIDHEGVIRWTWVTSKEQRLPDYDLVMEEAKKIAAIAAGND